MSLTTAAPLLALLKEKDDSVKSYALESINGIVDQDWPELSNDLPDIEALYDDLSFPDRRMAALVASKVYYNLGEYETAVKFALAAEECFNIEEKSQFVETIVSKSIEMYIAASTARYLGKATEEISPKLTQIFEKMLDKCVASAELKLALGIALEGYRLDIATKILNEVLDEGKENGGLKLINYVLTAASTTVVNSTFRVEILKELFSILISMQDTDYSTASKVVANLNDGQYAIKLFQKLKSDKKTELLYQISFDLVNSASQSLLHTLRNELMKEDYDSKVLEILSGIPTSDFQNTFLYNNKNIDIGLLNKTKGSMDGKFSLFHTAVSVANGFMHAGTTDNSFIKANLSWLGKAQNWAKFTATASLGVIHKGNLVDGRRVMAPYLPGSGASSRYIKGGSLYGLGLIYAGFGDSILDYLKTQLTENSSKAGDEDANVLLHGASLGVGLAAMGTANEEVNEVLTEVLYTDLGTPGEAAALGLGLTNLGSGDEQIIDNMYSFALESSHGSVTRSLSVGLSLVNYNRQEHADDIISKMLESEEPSVRYGGAFTIAMAYVGTGNNNAIKKLLHIAVSDSDDDVRRAAATSLGFVLLRDYTTVPRIVELLSKSHNPHVRCGTAFALGIACAGKALDAAVSVLEPLTKDPVDFVRQAAMISLALIMIQQTEKLNPKVAQINENFLNVATNKHQEGLTKFGACVAQGIMNAGGRNITVQLENPETGTLDVKSVVGLLMFTQFWYWYPLAHFLSLSFTPTAVVAVRASDLAIPKFELNCFSKEDTFSYPKMYEVEESKQIEKVAAAVLSTTARAKARSKKTKKDKEEKPEEEVVKKHEDKETVKHEDQKPVSLEEEFSKNRYSAVPYKIPNMTRVLPQQSKYVTFDKDSRFVPVRKSKNVSGIIIVVDTKPAEPVPIVETVREAKDVNAPLPTPFKVEDEIDFDRL
ncbi:proteasome regulatory particle base subunit RPN2 KNAG_0C04180 [Huiozyma naganishii CBS 8797]|uniref:26S proteasome regulatory subunit RPN2 n=1 Tax=Huiozyma naganishii (strain ATCC MYA-139 / BCRC 22969 / CBS 8797 / KCTC 17520 / NBRC 10181 / NCYC 3082 / Yp74L-3) TaxID=1071383 RepID=J7R3W8_HUIN7|nr:hypothetical protein KNAG_0C04180 [Kazachstania naganishii CBS 8797]CCK69520.1 hypothetical protein KNAG_0C04180 [Kazachstania naganishii CBS 8797]